MRIALDFRGEFGGDAFPLLILNSLRYRDDASSMFPINAVHVGKEALDGKRTLRHVDQVGTIIDIFPGQS